MSKFENEFIEIKELILEARNIAVATHINPDGDCIGSGLALVELVRKLGKNATLFNEQGTADYFSFLVSKEEVDNTPVNDGRTFDLVIFCDCGDIDRLGKPSWILDGAKHIVNIDHHATNTLFGEFNVVDDKAAATGMIIYRMYKTLGVQIDKHVAELLYMAIATDSGNFSYSSTTKETHYIGGELLEYGVDVANLTQKLFRTTSEGRIRLMALAFATLHMYCDGRIAVMQTTKAMFNETGTTSEDSEGFVSYLRDIKGVEIAAFLRDTTDGKLVKVSLRSNGTRDVSKIAESLGGGGHVNAAGCSIEGKIPEAEKLLVDILTKELQ